IKARARMIVLYDMSSFHNALVVGTGNKTELMLGYFTHFGDGACALEPIGGLYKTEVKELAKYLGVPQSIIDKPPSAGLWDGQTDEDELGATYEQIDECLEMIIEDNIQAKDMEGLPQFYTEEIRRNREIMLKLINMIEKNKFKSQPPAQMEN
ncbi:MAG: NAD(+) synthase, partial [Novosphingobium sp.]|nr:NAD(+) synthase [Novosphingobium sp.]